MNIFETLRDPMAMSVSQKLAFLLSISLVLWATGAPFFLNYAKAANITQISDTLSDSNNADLAKHTIRFTNTTPISAGQTVKIVLDTETSAFQEAYSSATTSDIFFSGLTVVASCSGANQATVAGNNYNTGSDENLTFTICAATTIASSTPITITVGSTTRLWSNPVSTGSYRISIGGTMADQGDTRVAVLPHVTLTASVNTSFTFTVTGLATTTELFGKYATTTASSTATALPFGTLASSTGAVVLGQQLQVSTNARNGFAVTVQENQPPTSSTGATIDLFKDGATTSTPTPWTAPTAVLDQPNTYGHFGVTSDDTDLNSNEFATGFRFAGNIDQPRVIFSHTGPADGVTQNKGLAKVAYKIQISDLQEAGTDYTDILTYVATPTF